MSDRLLTGRWHVGDTVKVNGLFGRVVHGPTVGEDGLHVREPHTNYPSFTWFQDPKSLLIRFPSGEQFWIPIADVERVDLGGPVDG